MSKLGTDLPNAVKRNNSKAIIELMFQTNEILDKIIEFHTGDREIKLIGFGLNGRWLEWIFKNPKIEIFCEDDN